MRTFKPVAVLLSCLSVFLLSGCKAVLLQPKGPVAKSETELLITAVILMLLIVIPVIVMTLVVAWKYRASNTKAKYSPNWAHSTKLEIVWWTIPCIIILILAILTWIYTHSLSPYKPLDTKGKPLTIQVIALNWKWLFIYPDQHIAVVNHLEFPVNQQVRFLIASDGPMNSFIIPALGGQIYAMAGMRTQMHLMASQPGTYNGFSANLSGDGFSWMTFTATATSEKAFNAWVKKAQQAPQKLTVAAYKKLSIPSENNPIAYYSSPTKHLFRNEMMKFMNPRVAKKYDLPKKDDVLIKVNY